MLVIYLEFICRHHCYLVRLIGVGSGYEARVSLICSQATDGRWHRHPPPPPTSITILTILTILTITITITLTTTIRCCRRIIGVRCISGDIIREYGDSCHHDLHPIVNHLENIVQPSTSSSTSTASTTSHPHHHPPYTPCHSIHPIHRSS